MNKKRVSAFLAFCLILLSTGIIGLCAGQSEQGNADGIEIVKSAVYNAEDNTLTVTVANTSRETIATSAVSISTEDAGVTINGSKGTMTPEIAPGAEKQIVFDVTIPGYTEGGKNPVINCTIQYYTENTEVIEAGKQLSADDVVTLNYDDILNKEGGNAILGFIREMGFSKLGANPKCLIMMLIAFVLLYLAIVKQFEPLLLLPIAFGMLLTNLPGADMFHEELFAGGHVHWDLFTASNAVSPGLLDYLYLGVKLGIYPCLIFIGVGAMTDFGPLIANPVSLLLGAAAQVGIFATFIGARYLGFTEAQAGSIGIIGGADGPTAIFVTTKLAPELLGPIAVAAYSYMALIPVIQTPIMKALTTKKERTIRMKELRKVSKTEKIIFPIVVSVFVALLIPSAGALIGSLMLGNLMRECGAVERLSKTVQNELMNIVTIFLGITVGATATANTFLSLQTIKIIVMGVVAFAVASAGGILLAKLMNLFLPEGKKINPLIGSAGVSAVPMAARVSQKVGQSEDPGNFLLMHAMGPNVAGVIGSAIAAGALLAMFG